VTSPKGVGGGVVVKGELSEKNGKRIERERRRDEARHGFRIMA